jgi:heme/copper-type cytochrome/quinol oxidase subunit 1
VHHMFATGLPQLGAAFFTASSMLIAIPSGLQIFCWIATLWGGRPVMKTPMLFVLGFIIVFVIGGLTGVMVASVPIDLQVHDTYFVVAHFHYVLIGGAVFPLLGAVYYWFPKFTGRMLSERLGRWNFWLAGTLEWATTSPPRPYNFARIPVVMHVEPLWAERGELPVATGLRVDARELISGTLADAEPELREASPEPSIWPLLAAVAVGVAFIASIFTPWAVIWGGIPVAIALIGWFWPKGTPEDEE